MPFIYKIENLINHKKYIGKTLYSIERRWKQHQQNVKREDLREMPLYHAILKYGVENFNVSCVEEVEDESILSDREQYWIKYYNTYNNGYNATLGGEGGLKYDYDQIWELWEQGYKIKEISDQMHCNDYVVRTVLDIHNISTEERVQRSYDDQTKTYTQYQRAVYQIDLNTDKVLKEYPSVSAAAKEINTDSSNLSKACRNNTICHGFKWRYINNDDVHKSYKSRPICQIDLTTNEIINIFPSASMAAKHIDGDSSYISKVCKGIYKTSKGYKWKYYDDIII